MYFHSFVSNLYNVENHYIILMSRVFTYFLAKITIKKRMIGLSFPIHLSIMGLSG